VWSALARNSKLYNTLARDLKRKEKKLLWKKKGQWSTRKRVWSALARNSKLQNTLPRDLKKKEKN